MQRVFLLLFCLVTGFSGAQAQLNYDTPPGRLWVLNEGSAEGQLGAVNFPAGVYDSLSALLPFGNAIHLDGCRLYLVDGSSSFGTGGNVLVYDLNAEAITDTVFGAEARQVATWNGQLLVTSTTDTAHFKSYDIANGFALRYTLDTTKVRAISEGIVVVGDTAFVAVNNFGFPADSQVVAIDLVNEDTLAIIETSLNPQDLKVVNGKVVAACNNFADRKTYDVIDPVNLTRTNSWSTGIGVGAFAPAPDGSDALVFSSDSSTVARLDLTTGAIDTTVIANVSPYGLETAPGFTLLSETDFSSFGRLLIAEGNTLVGDTIETAVSPRRLLWQGYEQDISAFLRDRDSNLLGDTLQFASLPPDALPPFTASYTFTLSDGFGTIVDGDVNAEPFDTDWAFDSTSFTLFISPVAIPASLTVRLVVQPNNGCRQVITRRFAVDQIVGVPTRAQSTTLALYPNPTSGALTLAARPGIAYAQASIYALDPALQLDELPAGVYLVSATASDGRVLRSRVVLR